MAASNKYPLITKKEVAARLELDGDFRKECLVTLYRRQTEDEQEDKTTRHKNRRGFMSSHAVNGTQLAVKVINGEDLSEEDEGRIAEIVCRYTKQLTAHLREQQLAENPELAEEAARFGV